MGTTLETLQVVIEGVVGPYKKAIKEATAETKKMVDAINAELDKMKSPLSDSGSGSVVDGNTAKDAEAEAKKIVDAVNEELDKVKAPLSDTDAIIDKGAAEEARGEAKEIVDAVNGELDKVKPVMPDTASSAPAVEKESTRETGKDTKRGAEEIVNATQPKAIKNPLETFFNNDTIKMLQRTKDKIKETMNSLKSGAIPGTLADSVKDYVREAQLAAGIKVHTEDYKQNEADIERAEKALEKLQQKQRDMTTSGVKKDSDEYKKLTDQIEAAKRAKESYNGTRQRMEFSGGGAEYANTGKIRNIAQSAGAVTKQIGADLKNAMSNIPGAGAVKGITGAFSKVFGGLKSVFSNVVPAIKKAGGAFGALIKKFSSGIPIIGRTKKSMNSLGGAGHGLGGIFRTLGMTARFMFASFILRGALEGAKEGMQNLAQYSGTTNASLSMLMSSLTQLKNALATAFAPILNAVAPLLNALIQKVIQAVSVIGMLFGALTGKGTFTKAKKVNQDYAASLGGATGGLDNNAKSADKANKANQKLQRTLLGFDQINKLDDHSQDNSSDSPSGSSPSGGLGGLSPSDMFEEVGIPQGIKDFANKLKEAWKNADFTEIGQIVGDKLNKALESIPWSKIQNTLNKVAKSIATFLNGFIETVNWGLVGDTLAKGINTVFMALDTFAKNFHWGSLGKAVGDGINGAMNGLDWGLIKGTVHDITSGLIETMNTFLRTTDWNRVGQTIAEFFNTILEFLYTAVTEFDWKKLGDSVADTINGLFAAFDFAKLGRGFSNFVKGILDALIHAIENTDWKQIGESVKTVLVNVDWNGIADRLFELIGAALGGVAEFLGGLLGDAVAATKEYFQDKIEECGGSMIAGILKGIGDAIKGVGEWIYEHVFTPIIDGFKKAFGIHSPSTVMAEQGGYIIQGLLQGLLDKIGSVITWFTELPGKIKSALGDAKNWLVEKGKGAIEGIKNGYESVKDSTLLSKIRNLKNEAFSSAGNIASHVKSKGTDIISGIREGYEQSKQSGILSKVASLKNDVFSSIGNVAGSVKSKGTDIIQGMQSGYSESKQSGLLSRVSELKSNVFSAVGDVAGNVRSKGSDIISGIRSGFDSNKFSLQSAVSSIPRMISTGIGSLWDVGRNAIRSFADGFASIHIPLPHLDVGWNQWHVGNVSFSVPRFGLSWYAKGGFPGVGEMFMARENGPELVGRMGNKNAVANNSQIIDGIAKGVKSAVVDAFMEVSMSLGGSGGGEGSAQVLELTIIADSETLYKTVMSGKAKSKRRFEAIVAI